MTSWKIALEEIVHVGMSIGLYLAQYNEVVEVEIVSEKVGVFKI